MSKQTLLLPVPTEIPYIDHPEAVTTFGHEAVALGESAVYHTLHADNLERLEAAAASTDYLQIEAKKADSLPMYLAKLAGPELAGSGDDYLTIDAERLRQEAQLEHRIAVRHRRGEQLELENKLDNLRQIVGGLSEEQRDRLDNYFGKSDAPFLQKVKETESEHRGEQFTWSQWLQTAATDEQLLNVLQWHTDALAHQQTSEKTNEIIETQKAEYKVAVQKGIDEGWLHPDAKYAIDKIGQVNVLVGDIFDTILKGRYGYHTPGTNFVVIQQGEGPDEKTVERSLAKNIRAYLYHELDHVVLGSTQERWTDEALAEHSGLVLKDGELDLIDPLDRSDLGLYEPERALIGCLATEGDEPVPMRLFTRFYSAREGADQARAELESALEKAWGTPYVMDIIQSKMVAYEKRIREKSEDLPEGEKLSKRAVQERAIVTIHSRLMRRRELIINDESIEAVAA